MNEENEQKTTVQKDQSTKKIGEILMEEGHITESQLKEALERQKRGDDPLGKILVDKGWIGENDVNQALAIQAGIPEISLSNYIIEPDVAYLLPQKIARKYTVIPVYKSNNVLTVAMAAPTNVFVIDEIRNQTDCVIEPNYAPEMEIERAIDNVYGAELSLEDILSEIEEKKMSGEELEEKGLIVKLVNSLITESVKESASDVHIEPEEKEIGIRYRVDGILHRVASLPKYVIAPITSRVKIMADLDIAERKVPQDGRILMRIADKKLDLRVSTHPTVHGENIVMRILDRSSLRMSLEDLGFEKKDLGTFRDLINKPYGIILVTGPTGSGKSTTLYSALQRLNKEDVNIMTVEDPVEYDIRLVRQTQINRKAGLTYAKGLKAILRQDPDIVMVGEMRDLETSEMAVRSALTGHLVFSTLHTNNAPSAFTRLIDMGIEPFLVACSLNGILAQRLVRRICDNCKEEFTPSKEIIERLKLEDKVDSNTKFYRGAGCQLCNQTGYRGRIAIFELLENSRKIQELALQKSSAAKIEEQAVKEGMDTLRDAAIRKLLQGITSFEEVFRVTQEEEM